MKRIFTLFLAAICMSGCSEQSSTTTSPETDTPVFTIETTTGPPIAILAVTKIDQTVTIDVMSAGISRTIITEQRDDNITRSIYDGEHMLYSITERSTLGMDDIYRRATNGSSAITVEFISHQQVARFTTEDGRQLEISNFVYSQLDEYQIKSALRQIREFLPKGHVLVDNPEMLLMESIIGNEDFQNFLLVRQRVSSELTPQGEGMSGCNRKVMLAAGIAAKYGCRYWAVPNPWIAGISATACVAGTALFWGCVVAEMARTPGDADASMPPAGGGSGGGGSSGAD